MADDKVKCGALWEKSGQRGTFYTGKLEADIVRQAMTDGKTKLLVFPNGYKDAENKPDLIVYLADPNATRG